MSPSSGSRVPLGRCLFAFLVLLGTISCHRKATGPIVIYLIDTLRADRLRLYEGPRDTAPAASDLARESATYTHAFSVSTWTRPSVATMFTSRLPSEVDALGRYGRLKEAVPSLPTLLHGAGWRTAAFIANGNIFDPRLGFQRGFDVFEPVMESPRPPARSTVNRAIGYIESQKSPRFFLFVHVIDPHQPISLEPTYQNLFSADEGTATTDRDRLLLDYDRSIRQADDQFHRLAEAIKRKGWWEGATIIYTADHGEEFFEHGRQGHGTTLFEEQVHIPLILKYPRGDRGGTRPPDPVTLADLLPTIADIADLPRLSDWIGVSLRRSVPPNRDLYFTEELDSVRAFALRAGDEKLIVRLYPTLERRLYKLHDDPSEQNGLLLPCGPPVDSARDLVRRFEIWRERDTAAYPGITFEKVAAVPIVVDLKINLAATPRPLLSDGDLCRLAPAIEQNALRVVERIGERDPYKLRLTTNTRGDLPAASVMISSADNARIFDLGDVGSPVRVHRADAHFIRGTITDEIRRHLRSLGYLAGGDDAGSQE